MESVFYQEKPILFSTPMVKAILNGNKTMTRRILKGNPDGIFGSGNHFTGHSQYIGGIYFKDYKCPYGQPGDRLWVRETWADIPETYPGNLHYKASATPADLEWFREMGWKWKPSIHMPRKAARIWLEIVSVRVEQLQSISEADILKEGIIDWSGFGLMYHWKLLWNEINAKRGFPWEDNPWVWVVEFRRI